MNKKINGNSEYIENLYYDYSLYVLKHRAIPHAGDGLKSATRRVLWMARNGQKYKTATLAGITMDIHPHAAPEGAINTAAAPYGNNIPLFDAHGSMGTMLNPTAYGAARYTYVTISDFTKDVIFRDIEIVPMQETYDGNNVEPKHFLPLLPLTLINGSEGSAIGFKSSIMPRNPETIIKDMLSILSGKNIKSEAVPYSYPYKNEAIKKEVTPKGNVRWVFEGEYEILSKNTIQILKLPYGLTYTKYKEFLIKLLDNDEILDIIDKSKSYFDIIIKTKRNFDLTKLEHDDIIKFFNLRSTSTEILNLVDFDGDKILSTNYREYLKSFVEWRLKWYVDRYERLKKLEEEDIQKYRDLVLAIKKNVGGLSKKIKNKEELKKTLEEYGIVNIEYIANIPVYRFTLEEKKKAEDKIKEKEKNIAYYEKMLYNENMRKDKYKEELKEILSNLKKGKYFSKLIDKK